MIIHFICKGNTYRSRLAETYLNSKKLKGIKAISSGVQATDNENGPITWLAARIIKNNNLIPYMSNYWTQTTKELLDKTDLIIFLKQEYLDLCKRNLGFNSSNYEIWDILDIVNYGLTDTDQSKIQEQQKIDLSEKTFAKIKEKIDDLILRI